MGGHVDPAAARDDSISPWRASRFRTTSGTTWPEAGESGVREARQRVPQASKALCRVRSRSEGVERLLDRPAPCVGAAGRGPSRDEATGTIPQPLREDGRTSDERALASTIFPECQSSVWCDAGLRQRPRPWWTEHSQGHGASSTMSPASPALIHRSHGRQRGRRRRRPSSSSSRPRPTPLESWRLVSSRAVTSRSLWGTTATRAREGASRR